VICGDRDVVQLAHPQLLKTAVLIPALGQNRMLALPV
jgi:hypothetical protein